MKYHKTWDEILGQGSKVKILRVLASEPVELTGRELDHHRLHGVAELALHHHTTIVQQADDHHRAGVQDVFTRRFVA